MPSLARSLTLALALWAPGALASTGAAPPAPPPAAPPTPPPATAPAVEPDSAAYWDALYRRHVRYVREPNAFLAHVVERNAREKLCPGTKALDLGMGEGRNAVFLAAAGFQVTGLDISGLAIEQARALAKEHGVTIDAVQADLFTHDFGVRRYDLIALVYFNPAVKVLDALKAAVTPGGLMLIEGQGERHAGAGPPAWSRFKANQLLRAFDDWRVLEYQDGIFPCDWNDGRPTHVVRILARKPPA